jgi:hypothetical protein
MTLSGECLYSGAIPARRAQRRRRPLLRRRVQRVGQADRVEGLGRLAQHHRGDRPAAAAAAARSTTRTRWAAAAVTAGRRRWRRWRRRRPRRRRRRQAGARRRCSCRSQVGSGGGLVSGETEQQGNSVKCCFAPQLVHVMPELGYYLSPTTAISLAGRIGFPIGANIPRPRHRGARRPAARDPLPSIPAATACTSSAASAAASCATRSSSRASPTRPWTPTSSRWARCWSTSAPATRRRSAGASPSSPQFNAIVGVPGRRRARQLQAQLRRPHRRQPRRRDRFLRRVCRQTLPRRGHAPAGSPTRDGRPPGLPGGA